MEYRVVIYAWQGLGQTQEIRWIEENGKKIGEWRGRYWVEFLNHLGQENWALQTVLPLENSDGSNYGTIAYFKRSTEAF